MLDARALWLVPGLAHPVFSGFAEFFRSVFRRFEALDYRDAYLHVGQGGVERRVEERITTTKPELLIYTQFPSSYSYLVPEFIGKLRQRCLVVGLGFDDRRLGPPFGGLPQPLVRPLDREWIHGSQR